MSAEKNKKNIFAQKVSFPKVYPSLTEGSPGIYRGDFQKRKFSSERPHHNSRNSSNNRCNSENPRYSRNKRQHEDYTEQLLHFPSIASGQFYSVSKENTNHSPVRNERTTRMKPTQLQKFSDEKTKPKQVFPSSPIERTRSSVLGILKPPLQPSMKESAEGLKKLDENGMGDSKKIGEGNFGVVYKVSFRETKEDVAVKRVIQDQKFKNRELQIMLELKHTNIVTLKHSFFSFVRASHNFINQENNQLEDKNHDNRKETQQHGQQQKQQLVYLNIVMEYIPSTLVNIIKFYHRHKQHKDEPPVELFPSILIKLYLYQAFRALAYLHGKRIAHRDIKPSNILINHHSHALKLCDFGSAKHISQSERNLPYLGSRNYRSPEMLLGSQSYDETVDIWALGCIIVEMVIGEILFKGESSLDQLVEVMKVLGTPSAQQIKIMNPEQKILQYPPINKIPLSQVLENSVYDKQLLDLLEQMIVYEPSKRIKPLAALMHPLFNELRIEQCRINGKKLPILFDFTKEEFATASDKNPVMQALIPHWYILQKQNNQDKPPSDKLYEVTK